MFLWKDFQIELVDFFVSIKFIYSEKATKFCLISTLDLSYVKVSNFQSKFWSFHLKQKTKKNISLFFPWQNFVAFLEYMNFNMNSIFWRCDHIFVNAIWDLAAFKLLDAWKLRCHFVKSLTPLWAFEIEFDMWKTFLKVKVAEWKNVRSI